MLVLSRHQAGSPAPFAPGVPASHRNSLGEPGTAPPADSGPSQSLSTGQNVSQPGEVPRFRKNASDRTCKADKAPFCIWLTFQEWDFSAFHLSPLPRSWHRTAHAQSSALQSGLCLAAWALKGREWRGAFAANSSAQARLWQEQPMDEGVPSPWASSQTSTPPESSLELSRQTKNSLDCKSVNVPFLPRMGWCE